MTYNKVCQQCKTKFTATGPATMYCNECNALRVRKMVAKGVQQVPSKTAFLQYRVLIRHDGVLHNLGTYETQKEAEEVVSAFRQKTPKVSQGQWSKDNRATTGIGYFMTSRGRIKRERRYCNRCGKDLLRLNKFEWVVHHIDHNRTNNIDENFELLCKRCHQLEHCIHDPKTGQYTQSSTTISEESTTQANGVGSGGASKDA